jgi:hypothetical protein
MKINIEIDMNEEPHKLDAHLRGPEYRHMVEGIWLELNTLLSQGHPYTTADAVIVSLHNKMKNDATYFNITL